MTAAQMRRGVAAAKPAGNHPGAQRQASRCRSAKAACCSEEVVWCAPRDLGLAPARRRVKLQGRTGWGAWPWLSGLSGWWAAWKQRERKCWGDRGAGMAVATGRMTSAKQRGNFQMQVPLLPPSPHPPPPPTCNKSNSAHTCEKDLFMCSSTSMMAAMLPHLQGRRAT